MPENKPAAGVQSDEQISSKVRFFINAIQNNHYGSYLPFDPENSTACSDVVKKVVELHGANKINKSEWEALAAAKKGQNYFGADKYSAFIGEWETLLFYCARDGEEELVNMLLKHGADPRIRVKNSEWVEALKSGQDHDDKGVSAADIARAKGHMAIAEIIEREIGKQEGAPAPEKSPAVAGEGSDDEQMCASAVSAGNGDFFIVPLPESEPFFEVKHSDLPYNGRGEIDKVAAVPTQEVAAEKASEPAAEIPSDKPAVGKEPVAAVKQDPKLIQKVETWAAGVAAAVHKPQGEGDNVANRQTLHERL